MGRKGFVRTFLLMLAAYSIAPLGLLLIPFADFEGSALRRLLAYGVSLMFWGGMLSGTAVLMLLNKVRIADKSKGEIKGLPGVLRFFSCKQGILMDTLFAAFFVLAVILTIVSSAPYTMRIMSYGAALFFGIMHSAFNGKNFTYLKKKG